MGKFLDVSQMSFLKQKIHTYSWFYLSESHVYTKIKKSSFSDLRFFSIKPVIATLLTLTTGSNSKHWMHIIVKVM